MSPVITAWNYPCDGLLRSDSYYNMTTNWKSKYCNKIQTIFQWLLYSIHLMWNMNKTQIRKYKNTQGKSSKHWNYTLPREVVHVSKFNSIRHMCSVNQWYYRKVVTHVGVTKNNNTLYWTLTNVLRGCKRILGMWEIYPDMQVFIGGGSQSTQREPLTYSK